MWSLWEGAEHLLLHLTLWPKYWVSRSIDTSSSCKMSAHLALQELEHHTLSYLPSFHFNSSVTCVFPGDLSDARCHYPLKASNDLGRVWCLFITIFYASPPWRIVTPITLTSGLTIWLPLANEMWMEVTCPFQSNSFTNEQTKISRSSRAPKWQSEVYPTPKPEAFVAIMVHCLPFLFFRFWKARQ